MGFQIQEWARKRPGRPLQIVRTYKPVLPTAELARRAKKYLRALNPGKGYTAKEV